MSTAPDGDAPTVLGARWTVSTPDGDAAVHRIETGICFWTGARFRPGAALAPADAGDDGAVPFVQPHIKAPDAAGRFYGIEDAVHGADAVTTSMTTVDPAWVLERCSGTTADGAWSVVDAQVEIQDFGVGVLQLGWRTTSGAARRAPEDLRLAVASIDAASHRLAPEVVGTLCRALVALLPTHEGAGPAIASVDGLGTVVLPTSGQVLWSSNHCRLSTDGDVAATARSVAAVVCPNDFRALDHRDHTYAAGVATSVTCSRRGFEDDGAVLTGVLRIQDSWWALYWALDRFLLASHLATPRDPVRRVADLRERIRALDAVHERLVFYGSRVDSLLVSTGARDLAVWNTLAAAWDLPHRMRCVERKLERLRLASVSAVGQIQQAQAGRINIMIFVFTALGVVASSISVAQFLQGKDENTLTIRLAVFALCFAIALAAVGASLGLRLRPRDGRREEAD